LLSFSSIRLEKRQLGHLLHLQRAGYTRGAQSGALDTPAARKVECRIHPRRKTERRPRRLRRLREKHGAGCL